MTDATKTELLNVDLELRADQDLTELVQAFEPCASALNCRADREGYFANLELASQPTDAESALRSFVRLVDQLPPRARGLWNQASKRDFSIGVQAGSVPRSFDVALTPDVLSLVAGVGAWIVVVVYAHAPTEAAKGSD